MSEDNLDVVRRIYEAWNAGDLDRAFELIGEDAELSVPPGFPESGTYRGRAAIRRWMEEGVLSVLADVRADPQELREAGDEVVAFIRYSGRGRASGIDVSGVAVDAHVWTLSDGKVRRLRMFQGTEAARAAAGLDE